MNAITDEFDTEAVISNISNIAKQQLEEIPHHDTISNVFENINLDELRNIQKYIVKTSANKYNIFKGQAIYYKDGRNLNIWLTS